MIVECTKRLADAMRIKPEPYSGKEASSFYDWHAKLFYVNRRKTVLLMNNKTRVCVVLYGVKMEHFKKFDDIVLNAIKETFLALGFYEVQVNNYINQCGSVHYSKTHDRSILGQLNDFEIMITWDIEDYLQSKSINLLGLNKRIAENYICLSTKFSTPIEMLKFEMSALV